MKLKNEGSTLRWIWGAVDGAKKWVALLILVRMLQSAAAVSFALAMRNVVDSAVSGERSAFARSLMGMGALIVVLLLFQALGRYVDEKASAITENRLRLRLLHQLLTHDFAQVTGVHTGEWITRMTSDVQTVAHAVIQIIPGLSGMAVRLVAALWLLLQLAPALVMLLLPGCLLMAAVSFALRKRMKQLHKQTQQADGKVRSFVQERLMGLLVVRTFTREQATQDQAQALMEDHKDARMKRVVFINLCYGALNAALELARILGIGVCSFGILNGTMTYGTMSAVLQLVNQLELPFANISSYLPQFYSMLASAERLMEVENFRPDSGIHAWNREEVDEYYGNRFDAVGLRDVCFSYPDAQSGQPLVLENVSFEIRKGEFVAFTGESGCGKSTALKALLCLYPLTGGEGVLRDADGTEHTLTARHRSLFAYVPQGNQLLSGTIRQTVAFGDEALMAQEEAIWKALRVACADTFVEELPHGLDTVLGERGSGLSEGQMQRLAIARAVLSGRPVLLLDEATSALDGPTEQRVLENLRTMTDRTVLIITHREAALSVCHRRIHFEKNEA